MWKKSRYKFADPEISRTFAPAFGNEAVMLDMLLQCICFAGCLPVSLRVSVPPFAREAQADGSLAPVDFRKNFRKKLRKTFGSLKITPYLCTRFWEANLGAELRKKTSKKVPQKFGGYAKNSLPLQPLSWKRKRHKRAIFDEIYINNTVVQERNWKQFRVNKRTVSTYIYR